MDSLTAPWRPPDTFASRLRAARRTLKLSQREAAEKCGLNSATWATWELGSCPRNMVDVARQIAAATGVDRDWLLYGTDAAERQS